MKRIFYILLLCSLMTACSKEISKLHDNQLLLLQVDYVTHTFEGGKVLSIDSEITAVDTIPIIVNYLPAGDFGNISLFYESEDQMIFDGSIIWMGTGERKFPVDFASVNDFSTIENPIPKPDNSKFQFIHQNSLLEDFDYQSIWDAISNLEVVEEHLTSHKKIGIFLYTPSVGAGDPNTWDYYVILNK